MVTILIFVASMFAPMSCVLATTLDSTVAGPDFSRYQVILARKPFGKPPPPPSPPPKRPVPAPPPFVKDLRMCAITDSDLGIRVGFVNIRSKPPKYYFLYIGESEDGIEVVDADYDMECALLRKGAEEHWIYLDGKSGGPPQSPAASAKARPAGITGRQRQSYAERLRKRRAALVERRRQALERKPKFTGKELEEHLKNYQMEVIRKGMPPLPIPLTREMDDQLVAEGVLPPLEE